MKPEATQHTAVWRVPLDVGCGIYDKQYFLPSVRFRVGGIVESMIWDTRGQHLAVLFKKTDLIAIFSTELHVVLQVAPW
jgi:hypothetical protein